MANETIRWNPMRETLSLRDAMNRLFEDSFVASTWIYNPDMNGRLNMLPVNMFETADEVYVQAVLPGLKTDDVDLKFQDGRLVIDANLNTLSVEGATWHLRELANGQYHREIGLPVDVDTDKIEARLENGYLTLRIPKAEKVKPKKIQIRVQNN